MSPAKRFLLIFAAVYVAGGVAAVILWGPPGLSEQYLAAGTNRHDHDRYIEIIQSEAYKRYVQRPNLVDLGADPRLAGEVEFVEEYKNRPDFQREERRRGTYNLFFDFWNAAAVVVLAVRFGRKPLLNFLDQQVADLRDKLERARKEREQADRRKTDARAKLDGFDEDSRRIAEQSRNLAQEEARQIHEATEQFLAQIDEETEERKAQEEIRARMLVKKELIARAVDQLAEELKASASQERQSAFVEQFLRELAQSDAPSGNKS